MTPFPTLTELPPSSGTGRRDFFIATLTIAAGLIAIAAQVYFIYRYGLALPHWDEWHFTLEALSGRAGAHWFSLPAGEHRAPLTKMFVYFVGYFARWDWRYVRFANVVLLGVAAIYLTFRIGKTYSPRWTDIVVILLALTPLQFETLQIYGWGFAAGLACYLWAIGYFIGVATHCNVREITLAAFATATVVLSAGPVGFLWGVGFTVAMLLTRRNTGDIRVRYFEVAVAVTILIIAVRMVITVPTMPVNAYLKSPSVINTLTKTISLGASWIGLSPTINFTILVTFLGWLWFARPRDGRLWAIAGSAVAGIGIVAYGRGGGIDPTLISRYQTFLVPVGVLIYLAARSSRSVWLPRVFCAVILLSQLKNWPVTAEILAGRYAQSIAVENSLKTGEHTPETVARQQFPSYPRFFKNDTEMAKAIAALRDARVSIFTPP